MKLKAEPNRLIKEKSPYLLQHAHNPVNWFPWGEEALKKARDEDRPIFLSIGYSTCHWCHVMERESFEDGDVAKLLNNHYVPIKVDREERPDIDQVYMTVCQAMTGQGGWPLTIFLTPDRKPFFAGTYFPKESKFGRAGLVDILEKIAKQWATNREELRQVSEELTTMVQPHLQGGQKGQVDKEILHRGYETLADSFDPRNGGFGTAPKFPIPHNLLFLLRYWKWTGTKNALEMVEKTLTSMYAGGIYDHLGFGFSRYAVDEKWLVPHFEKMLYDNALLAMAYLETYQATGNDFYAQAAREIFTYVLRDMTSPQGAFYSAEDADSEGEEGKFYLWTPEEITRVLGKDLGATFCRWYGVTPEGNFEGKSILNLIGQDWENMAPATRSNLTRAKKLLFDAREERVHPGKDDKILTAWNGLMIAALAMGARILGETSYREAAAKAAEFIWSHLRDEKGRLLARYREGEAAFKGYLDDYAFFAWALLELYQSDHHPTWLERALELQDQQNELFWDKDRGGYFFSGTDAEELLARPKEIYDGALPSGNSAAALNLLRLARLTGREELASMANSLLEAFAGRVREYPAGYTLYLTALSYGLLPGREIVVASPLDRDQVRQLLKPLGKYFAPETVFLYRFGRFQKDLDELAPFTQDMESQEGQATFYICENYSCRQPTTDLNEVERVLKG